MQFKLSPIEVPPDDPFRFDCLERRISVEAIFSLLDNLNGPFVLAIDSPWGTGKTTLIRMLKAFLELKGFSCLYFNAWETDFTTDPLMAFLGEMDQLMKTNNHKGKALEKTKKIATLIAKRVLPVAGKIATGGLLDLDSFTEKALAELVSDSVNDAVDAYSAEKNLIETFHRSLSEAM
jgi:predicted KAP-like P-loop ATPase